jgi:hypothetical protein
MRFRSAVLSASVGALAFAPLPAVARDEPAPSGNAAEISEKLNDPMTQYAVAGMLSAMSKALLEISVAPVVDAVETASGRRVGNLPRDARVADLTGTDQSRVREQIVEHVPRAMAAMGALARAAQAMTPELERMARTMRQSMPK